MVLSDRLTGERPLFSYMTESMVRHSITMALSMMVFLFAAQTVSSQSGRRPAPPRRALPPVWSLSVRDIFFDDVRTKLVGERPNYSDLGPDQRALATGSAATGIPSGDAGTEQTGFTWSQLIAAEVIEDEVKQISRRLSTEVDKPGPFKGGDFKKARASLSTLAFLFGVTAEYDAEIRWKAEAAGLRDRFSRAGFNCKVGTDQSYEQAKARRSELEDMIRGDRPSATPASLDQAWFEIADRTPLMQRLEAAVDGKISPAMAGAGVFRRQRSTLTHEAQIVAAIAKVIAADGYDYADDEIYLEYAERLQEATRLFGDAVEKRDYKAAREAAGEMNKACSECHEDYRS